jgi:hypothetical protein
VTLTEALKQAQSLNERLLRHMTSERELLLELHFLGLQRQRIRLKGERSPGKTVAPPDPTASATKPRRPRKYMVMSPKRLQELDARLMTMSS